MIEPFVKDLKEDTRAVIHLLNARLADAIDLKLAVKQARWNIQGRSFILQNELPSFIALHELLDQIAGRLDEHSDSMAERVVKTGGLAAGTVQAVMKATSLPSYPANVVAGDTCGTVLNQPSVGYAISVGFHETVLRQSSCDGPEQQSSRWRSAP